MSSEFWLPEQIKQCINGKWLKRRSESTANDPIEGLSTDTRTLQPGQIFCALSGLRFNGHDYLNTAAQANSPLLIVESEEALEQVDAEADVDIILVADTFKAMARLATAYRKTFTGKVIAITGSVGKTTTKDMIYQILSRHIQGSASQKSYNNHIGVPLTILNAKRNDAFLVVEVGTNHPGEIANLSQIVAPDIAIITHVGRSHIAHFENMEALAREKASLLNYVKEKGRAYINGDIELLQPYSQVKEGIIQYGYGDHCDLRITSLEVEDETIVFSHNEQQTYTLNALGEHNAMNASAAIAVARYLKIPDEHIHTALADFNPSAMRLNKQTMHFSDGSVELINDAYNANPESVLAALQTICKIKTKGRRVAILGDMLELGDDSPALHADIGEAVNHMPIDMLITVGEHARHASEAATIETHHFNDTDALASQFLSLLANNDLLLLKASRGLALEKCISQFENQTSGAA